MLAGVTPVIHGNTNASLGERFLKYQMFRSTVFDASAQISSAIDGMNHEMERDSALQSAANRFLTRTMPEVKLPVWVKSRIISLCQLIAMLRANVDRDRYRDTLIRKPQHEVATRLAKQLVKLGTSMAAMQDREFDHGIYELVERVALDTAIGFNLDIVQSIMSSGGRAERSMLVSTTHLPSTTIVRQLDDLEMLQIIKRQPQTSLHSMNGRKYVYEVSRRVRTLWDGAHVLTDHMDVTAAVRIRKHQRSNGNAIDIQGV
jgi:hypothetical protein